MNAKTIIILALSAFLLLGGGMTGAYFYGRSVEKSERIAERKADSVLHAEKLAGARDTAGKFEDTLRVVRANGRILEIQLANLDEYYKTEIAALKLKTAKEHYEQIIQLIGTAKDSTKPYCFDSTQVKDMNTKLQAGEICEKKVLTLKSLNENYYREKELLQNQKMKYLDIMGTQEQEILDKNEEIRELKEVPFISWKGLSAVLEYGNTPDKIKKVTEGLFRTGFETEIVMNGKFSIAPGIYYTSIAGKDLMVTIRAGVVILGRK